jgi:hypothetical protein
MISFIDYLKEETQIKSKQVKYIRHPEENIFDGHEGVALADKHLRMVHDHLIGKKIKGIVNDKYDSSLSFIMGTHPETNKFFVAPKSTLNKDLKVSYTPKDIDLNHEQVPGLPEKLKTLLTHGPKIVKKGVVQGEYMYDKGDLKDEKSKYSFQPNLMNYSVNKKSDMGARIAASQLGIVLHTQYSGGKSLASMRAEPMSPETRASLGSHPDVNNIDPTPGINQGKYTPAMQKQFIEHMDNARIAYSRLKPEAFDAIKGHEKDLSAYIDSTTGSSTNHDVEGYIDSLHKTHQKDLKKANDANSKKAEGFNKRLEVLLQNKQHFKNVLEIHNHMQKAKNVLVKAMDQNSDFEHSINDKKTGKEGSVLFDNKGNASKIVNRKDDKLITPKKHN